ncbi:eukaryotic translation initiation factor 4E-1-like protein [Cinnamomum micranthum f. kanehirae]|uniref:eIF-4F 25 kDa subunit n=1 Tax=Cinnamomum micranthum f. kanehirae TaxID=337451 RepID=A0A3S3P1T6_9MAGN|nr:eukaryotic translation initiation factor 4E-1-like protein [Cinnamomum micranthum f. kanehirae]
MASAKPTVSVPPTRCPEEKERDKSRKHHMVEGEMLESNNGCECDYDDDDDGVGVGGGDGIASGTEHPNAPPPPPKVHPLEHSWTFWFDDTSVYKDKQIPWGSAILPIHTFSTVEDFWGLYNNIKHPSKLAMGVDFHCFKYKIEPKWEDPICANGGRWTISCLKGKADTLWLHTLLALIGEQFDHGDEICGAVVNVRGRDRIALWTKNASNEAAQMSIGRQWKEFLDYNETIGFTFHEDAKRNDKATKNRYAIP